jgi:hypothetical protein
MQPKSRTADRFENVGTVGIVVGSIIIRFSYVASE